MKKDQIVVGLDLGTTMTRVFVGRANAHQQVEILGLGQAPSHGITQGVVTNIDKTVEAIRTAVQQAENQSSIDIRVVNALINGGHITSTLQQGSLTREAVEEEITFSDAQRLANAMRRLVTKPGTEVVDVVSHTYSVDQMARIHDPVGMVGVQLGGHFHLITAQSQAIHTLRKCIDRAGLNLDQLYLAPLVASLAVLNAEEKEAGVALIDLGGGTTNLALFHEGRLQHLAVWPMGVNTITGDIKRGCQVTEAQAKRLQTHFGSALLTPSAKNEVVTIPGLKDRSPKDVSRHTLLAIVQARTEELISWIQAQIEQAGFAQQLGGGIVLTGGGAQLRDIAQLFTQITGHDTRLGIPSEYLANTAENPHPPDTAVAIGLVLAGYRPLDERIAQHMQAERNAHRERPKKHSFWSRMVSRTKGLLVDDYEIDESR